MSQAIFRFYYADGTGLLSGTADDLLKRYNQAKIVK